MKLELQFNEQTYKRQMELLYEMGFGRKKTYYKNSNYIGFASVFIGIMVVVGNANVGYVFIVLGLINVITYYNFYFKNKKITQKYKSEMIETIKNFKENPIAFFEFNNDGLTYTDYTGSLTINWNNFLQYMVKEENVFLITKTFQPFIVGKSEVGQDNYSEILSIIESRVKNKTSR